MKLLIVLLLPVLIGHVGANKKQSVNLVYQVTVENGYGSGQFRPNDTVHIFSKAYGDEFVFDKWKGDKNLLRSNDWHAWFIMPERNVHLTANLKPAKLFKLQLEHIKGVRLLKPVYYYFPANSKGTIVLLHGSGGSARQFSSGFETHQLVKELITDGFGILITECEETTEGKDLNGDGQIRWNYLPARLENPDYANIKIILDVFIQRKLIEPVLPVFSAGMSNGGAFASMLGPVLNFKAGISYCAQSPIQLALIKKMPFMYLMQSQDDHKSVGREGNMTARANSQKLNTSGICSQYLENPRSPLYPERFARRGDISVELSQDIFNEMRESGLVSEKGYLKISGRQYINRLHAGARPLRISRKLTVNQWMFVAEQMDCAYAGHRMFSDLSKSILQFLNYQCSGNE